MLTSEREQRVIALGQELIRQKSDFRKQPVRPDDVPQTPTERTASRTAD